MPIFHKRPAASATVLGAVLLLTACSGGDKAVVDEITVDAASLELSGADEKLLGQHFVVAPRTGSEAETLEALTALGLDSVTTGRTIDGSTVTYTDWSAVDGSSEVTAARVVLSGVHMGEDGATFDAVQITDMGAVDYDDIATDDGEGNITTERRKTVDASLSELVLIEPTPELALDISELLRGVDDASDETVSDITRDMDFRAMRVADFRADVSDETATGLVSVGQVVIGKNAQDEQLDIVVESVDFDWTLGNAAGPAAGQTTLKMDGMTALGVNTASLEDASGQGGPGGALAGLMSPGANMPYRSVDLGTVSYQSKQFDIAFDGFEADSEGSGNTLTMRSVLQPMEFTIKDATGTPLAPHMAVLEANGLSTVTLKGSATSEVDRSADRVRYSDAMFEFDGGLRADCDYSIMGTMAAAKALRDSGVTQPDFSSAQTNEDISRLIEQMEAYSQAQNAANANIKIESGRCVIQDVESNSLVTRGYAVASEVMGRPVPVLKASAQGLVAMTSLAAPDPFQRGMADTVGSGLIEFLGDPGKTMTITLAPAEPVPMSALRGDNSVPFDALGISVSVE